MKSNDVISYLSQTYGTTDWTRYEAVRHLYYDYIRYPVAGTSTELTFFNVPRGGVDPVSNATKTLEQTNMERASQVPAPFLALELRTHLRFVPKGRQATGISNATRLTCSSIAKSFFESLANLSENGVLLMDIDNKNYLTINQPFVQCPPGFGPKMDTICWADGTAINNTGVWGVLRGNERSLYALTPPLFLQTDQLLRVAIRFPNGAMSLNQISSTNVALDVGILLTGYSLRPVQ